MDLFVNRRCRCIWSMRCMALRCGGGAQGHCQAGDMQTAFALLKKMKACLQSPIQAPMEGLTETLTEDPRNSENNCVLFSFNSFAMRVLILQLQNSPQCCK